MIVAALADDTPDRRHFARIVLLLERFSLRVYGVGRYKQSAGDSTLFGYARDFTGDFEKLVGELKASLDYYAPDSYLRESLMRNDLYGYGAADTMYILWKYENHLRESHKPKADRLSEQEYMSDSSATKLTLEHVLPQHNAREALGGREGEERLLHSLGNLALLSHSANSGLKDLEWSVKKATFARYPFKMLIELERFVPPGAEWGAFAIEKRREAIVEFAVGHWDYKNI